MASKVKTVTLSLVINDVTNSVTSFQLSKTYVKRLLKIGALNIIYQRIDIPASEFVAQKYETAVYMLFKPNSNNRFIISYHAFVHGFIEAVEKDYLKEMFIYILDKSTHQVLETYIFKVKYNKSSTLNTTEPQKVRDATIEFLKAFSSIPGEKWSPDAVELFMELSYNDDTPGEYEPPYFEHAPQPLSTIHPTNEIIRFGVVNTGFHKVSAWGSGRNFPQTPVSTPAPSVREEENEQPTDMKRINDENDATKKQRKRQALETDSAFINIFSDEANLENISVVSSEEIVNCVCKWDLPEEFKTTQCTKCYNIVHLVCHGYLALNSVNLDTFVCYYCDDIQTDTVRLNKIIKLRIILYGIHLSKELPKQLDQVPKAQKKYILGQLEKLGVYNSKAKTGTEIDMNMLNEALLATFTVKNSQFFE